MIKIVAINDPSKDEEHQEDETITQVTKEAQETIAVSEYMRALSLKQNGKPDFALSLFEDLLRTQVLSDVPDDDKDNKLFSVKYNCHRNIGLIYEDREEFRLALKSLVQAIELDDGDVFTQCKIGRLSLKLNNLLLAKIAFEKCLERNPNHCGAKDGLLQTLCNMEDVDQAYGFALKCFEEDRRYGRAIRVLKEIRARFKLSLEYYDGIHGRKPEFDADCKIEYDPENSVFPPRVEIGFTKENYATLTDDFQIPENNLNWITFGKLIIRVYHHLEDGNYNLCSWFKWEDWVGSEPVFKVPEVQIVMEKVENGEKEETEKNEDPGPAENGEKSPEEGENGESEEKKNSRRRCSDLDFLKEWGWHKNRRSSRKKQKEEEETVDTTMNGFLRRILPSYFNEEFDTRRSPFAPASVEVKSLDDSENLDHSKADAEDEEKFYELTKESFQEFMATFKTREFDIVIPMFQWLRFISLTWNQTIIPSEILILFKKIYKIYEDFVDYHSMYHLPEDDFKSTFRMAMLYFELMFDEFEETKAEISDEFMRKKDFLQMNIGFVEDDLECTRLLTRLIWLSYCIQIHNNNYKDALGYLYKLEEVYEVPKYSEISVELKNCKNNKYIDGKTVKELIVKIERKINLASVKNLYETQNFQELIEILRDSIIYSTEPKVNIDNLTLKIQTQIEVFLECLWSLDRIEECLDYAEKSLCYAVDNFLSAPTEYRLEEWASLVNYCLVYIESATKEEHGGEILFTLGQNLSRLVQSLVKIIESQLDVPAEKNNPKCHLINLNTPWTILFHLVLKENDLSASKKRPADEEEFESLPNSLSMFFTAHEFLGKKQWCMKDKGKLLIFLLDTLSPIYRTPLLEPFREIIVENLEQTTYCLYGYPVKKAKLRHIEEHDAKNIDLTWERAIQLFDLFRPDTLPEFDSFKLQSISSEMEQLLQKIIPLIPKCLDIAPFTGEIKKFINGTATTLPKETNILPAKIASIYYLLADFYFKNQETGKAIRFYINDLTMKPDRFDSWASLSLCKESKLEMKLNGNASVGVKEFLEMADQTINCFNQCLKLKKTITILTEFASFTYHLHSFCSRNLKQSSETLSMENFSAIEDRKDKFLNISFNCFSEVCEAVSDSSHELNSSKTQEESDDNHDEKWYYHFMLGKIAEKKKESPSTYLTHYRESMKFLYEDNATYPIRINHSNPSHLAIESLEVFYRISACIMKYLEQHSKINKPIAKLFLKVLKEMSSSPFAYNRAKINKGNINAMKHKMNASATEATPAKQQKTEAEVEKKVEDVEKMEVMESVIPTVPEIEPTPVDLPIEPPIQPVIKSIIAESTSRRVSQESVITTTTTTSTRTSSSADSDSSSSDSDSSSSDETDEGDKENVFVSQEVIDNIYKMCIKNLEECVTRFPEHYKSIYRLVHHFLNTGDSMEKCKQLLLTSTYKTALGSSLGGLFSERKNNNFFNGIWRIPSSEIDRPGNFTTHLSKCVIIMMDVLKKTNDYETLMDLALQLQRNNESADKKYLNDVDKKELFHQAVTCCVQAFKNKLREITTGESEDKNRELLSLMLDIFKSHRKTFKIFQQKDQSLFSGVLVEVYKEYIKDKMILPDNANLTDLAFKMCQTEINYRKNLEKGIVTPNPNPPPMQQQQQLPVAVSSTTSSPILIKTVSEINKSVTPSEKSSVAKSLSTPTQSGQSAGSSARTKPRNSSGKSQANQNSLLNPNASINSLLMSMYSNPSLMTTLMNQSAESTYMNEFYKSILGGTSTAGGSSTAAASAALASLSPQQQLALIADPMSSIMSSLYTNPSPTSSPKSTSNYEKKYLESLKNIAYGPSNSLMGLQQNLMSNSLSITTTTMTASTSTAAKVSTSKSQSSMSKKSGQSSKDLQVSITKSDTSKYSSVMRNLPDLPKSLSITPSMPATIAKVNRVSDKGKVQKVKQPSSNFGRASLSITGEAGMQGSYQDFLKNYMPGQSPSQSSAAPKPPKPSLNVPAIASSKQQKQKSSSMPSSSHPKKSLQTKSAQLPYDFGKNIASSFSGLPSPTLSISPYSHSPSLSPSMSMGNLTSPQKTLQQKLAERKQQNQQQKKKQADDDVIVLD